MHTLFVSSGLSPEYGGAAISEASLAQNLQTKLEIKVFCRADRYSLQFVSSYDLKVIPFRPWDVFGTWLGKKTPISDCLEGATLLHLNGHWRWENYFWARLALQRKIPYLLHPRGMCLVGHRKKRSKKIFNLFLGNFIVSHATKVVCLSQFEVAQLAPYGMSPHQIVVIPNGISRQPSRELPAPQYFLYYGRLESRKNLLFLLDGFSLYRKKGGKFPLVLMGPAERGYDQALLRRAQKLQLGGHFKIIPATYGPEKWEVIHKAVAVVYPTLDEPFGRVPFEAVSAGVPAILPGKSGGAEYLGTFSPDCIYEENLEGLASTLIRVDQARIQGKELGVEKARYFVGQELQWDTIREKVLGLYQTSRF